MKKNQSVIRTYHQVTYLVWSDPEVQQSFPEKVTFYLEPEVVASKEVDQEKSRKGPRWWKLCALDYLAPDSEISSYNSDHTHFIFVYLTFFTYH